MRKHWILGIALVAILGGTLGISIVRNSTTPIATFRAPLTGAAMVPPVNTAATGDAVFTLSPDGTTLSFTLNVTNLSDTSLVLIHMAPAGSSGPPVALLFSGPKPGVFTGVLAQGTITSATLTGPLLGQPLSAFVNAIRAGNVHIIVHTAANPGGELRGQIQ